ncbi:polynucleotide 5'-hydroxyl-kinase NOL9 [Tanacetum coccineum]
MYVKVYNVRGAGEPCKRCFFFGDATPRSDPKLYMAYVRALYDYFHEKYRQNVDTIGVPLVVNTPGWVEDHNPQNVHQLRLMLSLSFNSLLLHEWFEVVAISELCGSDRALIVAQQSLVSSSPSLMVNTPGWVEGPGYDILVEMLNHIAPTQVVKIRVSAENKNLPRGAFWLEDEEAHEVTLLEINSDRYDSLKKTAQAQNDARLLRDLRLLAYFRKCFPTDKKLTTLDELDHGLAVHPPYEIPVSRVTIKQLHSEAPHTETNNTSTSRIVGLAISSSSPEDLPCCIGLGILMGEDTSKDALYLITPIREHILKKVDMLLHGLIKIPDCLRQVQGHVASNTLRTN